MWRGPCPSVSEWLTMYMLVVQLCLTLCNPIHYIVNQASLPVGYSRQEYWSGLPFLSPGDLPNPGIEPGCPALQADSLLSEPSVLVGVS